VQFFGALALDPEGDEHPRHVDRGEHRSDDADEQHHREAADRAGAEVEHQRRGDGVGDVGIEDSGGGFLIARLQRVEQPPSPPLLLTNALVDQHVGIDRSTDRQHEAGNAGQGERSVEQGHDAKDHQRVDDQPDHRIHAEPAVGDQHESHHQQGGDDAGNDAEADRIRAKVRADGALFDRHSARSAAAGAQRDGELIGFLDREAAGDAGLPSEDRLADRRGGEHDIVEDDRERLADIARASPWRKRVPPAESNGDRDVGRPCSSKLLLGAAIWSPVMIARRWTATCGGRLDPSRSAGSGAPGRRAARRRLPPRVTFSASS
jgi:hypothetical protein